MDTKGVQVLRPLTVLGFAIEYFDYFQIFVAVLMTLLTAMPKSSSKMSVFQPVTCCSERVEVSKLLKAGSLHSKLILYLDQLPISI